MTEINRIFGSSNYGVGGFGGKKEAEANEAEVNEAVKDYKETQVDPSKVMDFMAANNNLYVGATNKTNHIELDAATKDRVADSMAEFEAFMNGAVAELGDENLALMLADVYSERN